MNLRQQFGVNVRLVRKQAGLSQEALADLADVARSYMFGIEAGERNPTLEVVERIAKALNIDPLLLLSDSAVGRGSE